MVFIKKGSWTWLMMIFIISKGQKSQKTLFPAKPSSRARKRWCLSFFLLDWKLSIHELKNSPTSSLFWWWSCNLDRARRWEVGSQGKFNSVFCLSVFLNFFVFSWSSWADSFGLSSWRDIWPFLLPRQLLSSQTYVSILFRFFFMIFFLSPYHHTIHSHSIVPLTSTFLYSWVGPQTTQPVFNPDPLNGVHLQGSLWRNKDGRKIPRDSQYQRFRLPAGLVGSQTKKSFNHITIYGNWNCAGWHTHPFLIHISN